RRVSGAWRGEVPDRNLSPLAREPPWWSQPVYAQTNSLGGGASAAGDHVHELLQVLGGPAFEGAVAVGLVCGHHRVAVVPVQARLGIEPEGPARALGDRAEGAGVGFATVGA